MTHNASGRGISEVNAISARPGTAISETCCQIVESRSPRITTRSPERADYWPAIDSGNVVLC